MGPEPGWRAIPAQRPVSLLVGVILSFLRFIAGYGHSLGVYREVEDSYSRIFPGFEVRTVLETPINLLLNWQKGVKRAERCHSQVIPGMSRMCQNVKKPR